MILVALTILFWVLTVLVVEWLWKRHYARGEYARKLAHIALGLSVATMPYYLSWDNIKIVGLIGLIAVIIMHYTRRYKSLYDIKRKSWGDILGTLAIVVLVFFEPPRLLFLIALLHTGLADGFAAIIGTKFGKGNAYTILGYRKSLAGTSAFFITSLIIMLSIVVLTDSPSIGYQMVIAMSVTTTLVENISPYGVDNALIIATVAGIFRLFA